MADKLEIKKIFEELDRLEAQNAHVAEELQRENEELLLSSEESQISKAEKTPKKSVREKLKKATSQFSHSRAKEEKQAPKKPVQASKKPAQKEKPTAQKPDQKEKQTFKGTLTAAFFGTSEKIMDALLGIRTFGERYRKWILASFATFVVALVGLVGIFNYYMAYEYSYNGTTLGVVKDKEEVLRITDLVQEALTEDRNMDVVIDKKKDIAFKRVVVFGDDTHLDTSEEVLKRMTYVGDINVKAYSIRVNGKNTAIVGSKEAAEDVLSGLKEDYTEPNAVVEKAAFAEDVEIKPVSTDLQRLQKEESAKEALKAGAQIEKTHIVTAGETLSDLADKYDMTQDELLELNPTVDPKQLVVGSALKYVEEAPVVTLETVEFVTYTENIDYKVVEKKSDKLYKGEKEVKKAGKAGQRTITARIAKVNGEEESKEIIVESIDKEPSAEEVIVGTKKRPPSVGDGKFIYPVKNFRFTSKFGWRWGRMHNGVDFAGPSGTPIVAGDGGIVTFAGYKGSLGNVVMIDHQNGIESWYAHNSSMLVKKGDKVYEGQKIALSGSTGRSTGPHLHFQINVGGSPVNPMPYLEK